MMWVEEGVEDKRRYLKCRGDVDDEMDASDDEYGYDDGEVHKQRPRMLVMLT